MKLEDQEIIRLFFQRSEQAITELSVKYGMLCRKIAVNILKNISDAEECVNDAWLGVWNTIPPQEPDPLLAYVCRIARNISITRYHANTAKKRNSAYDIALDELEDSLASGADVWDELSAKELAGLIDRFLDTLDKESRVMFVWRYWYAEPVADIAARMKMRDNNVSVRLLRIRKKLRQYLQKEGYEV